MQALQTDGNEQTSQYLSFTISYEEYMIPIDQIREIVEYQEVKRISSTPTFVAGVTNLRGNYIPVVNLGLRLLNQESQIDKRTCIIVVEIIQNNAPFIIGLLADKVSRFVELSNNQIKPTPDFGTQIRADFILAIGQHDNQSIIILNLESLLEPHEIQVKHMDENTIQTTA